MKTNRNSATSAGFSSIEFLVVLLFLSISTVAVITIIKTQQKTVIRFLTQEADRQTITAVADSVVVDLKDDATPLSNSKQDSFWLWNGKTQDGVSVSIRSLSSCLNPNFVRVSLCEKTDINSFFLPGQTAALFQQYREDNGLFFLYEDVQTFFSEETYEKYFSVYGWANINLSDEFALRTIVSLRTGSEAEGERFRQKLRTVLIQNQLIQSETDFKLFAGVLYDYVFPYIMTEPGMNIHFIEPLLLESILSYPDYAVSAPQAKAAQLLSLREIKELTQSDILNVLGIDKTDRLYYYFGTTTWFWEITLKKERETCVLIVCRKPAVDANLISAPEWYIIERRWV